MCVIFDVFHQCFIVFYIYRSFVSLGRFIPKYFILFIAMVNGIVSLISLSVFSLIVYRNWRRQWKPTPVLLPGKSHGWRSLVGYSPWGCEESDMTERLHFHFSLSCIGAGKGSPLQCLCLENPRDGGAWWAAVSGVTQSRTRLKQLSSSGRGMTRKLKTHGGHV